MTETSTVTTIDVPKSVLGPIISTYVRVADRDKSAFPAEVSTALRAVFTPGLPAGELPDTFRVDAEDAWHLAHNCDVLYVYGLDEADEATYAHPAVIAEEALQRLVADQAPEVDARLSAELEASVANAT